MTKSCLIMGHTVGHGVVQYSMLSAIQKITIGLMGILYIIYAVMQ